jgi:trehalose 6-phosphate phosphatase
MPDTRPPLDLSPHDTAIFLDFDGTLAEIVDDPEAVGLAPDQLMRLGRLAQCLDGALAVISGRSIEQLDRFLAPLRLPLAGVHGRERRNGAGRLRGDTIDEAAIAEVANQAEAFAATRPGVLVERKPASVAIHYRTAPEFGADVVDFAARRVAQGSGLTLLRGKMVVEIAAGHRTKGDAIADFLREQPFAGRKPVFAGDDVTDEDGFRAIARHDGIAIKIGPGPSEAPWRLESPRELHGWLEDLDARWR